MQTFEDRWSLCRPSKTDDQCEIYVATLAQNIDGIVVCAEGLHFSAFINPWRACAASVILVVLCVCVCVCVCMYARMYVCPLISAASHIGITQQRYQRVHSNTAMVLNFFNFPKNASFKSYGVICLPRAPPASWSFSYQEISFYASVKPIATFSLLRQRVCGRQRAIRSHRLVKWHRYTDHEY